ncbi:MAG: sensor histidine kinase [Anaerolineae bacterium]
MDEVVLRCDGLNEKDIAFLQKVEEGMSITADLSRADVLLYSPLKADEAVVVAQARPHSVPPIHRRSVLGNVVHPEEEPAIFHTLRRKRFARGSRSLIANGAPVVQEVHPISRGQGRVIGALSIETNLIERERHLRRSKAFRKALRQLQAMCLRGELEGAKDLSHFGEHDGILVVDAQKQILYLSGIATNLYRKIGYMEDLVGRKISTLDTADDALVSMVMEELRCLEREVEERGHIWVKKGIPLLESKRWLPGPFGQPPAPYLAGVLLTIHDETEARRRERELKVKSAMIQEIHHRVKNNLQTIVSLLRLQARRATSEEARQVLHTSINRILSVAVVHEFLSSQEEGMINIRQVSQRIANQVQESILSPEKNIHLKLRGPNMYLPTHQATTCALVINELLQNALEHGYERKQAGTVTITLEDRGDEVKIEIVDDGGGLPVNFDLGQDGSLGLRIVHTLVQDDLKGYFELKDINGGTSATVIFPKLPLGGERLWNE